MILSLIRTSAWVLSLFFCSSAFATPAATEAPQVVHRIQPGADDFSDLAALGEAVGDRRIVMLDELTHGEGNVFALKARIVRYLHQERGFDVLVLESGMFDVARIWQQQERPIRELAPGNIFYMYANSEEVWPLFDYVDAMRQTSTPLALAGFDNRLSGELSRTLLVSQLRDFLAVGTLDAGQHARLNAYLPMVQRVLDGEAGQAGVARQAQFLADSRWLDELLQTYAVHDAGFWRRINASLRRMAEVVWQRKRFDEHDLEMAGNLQWLLEEAYPGRKVVVWGQYVHVNRKGGFQDSMWRGGQPLHQRRYVDNMTTALPAQVRAEAYVLHFAGAEGAYLDFVGMSDKTVSVSEASLERHLAGRADAAAFVDLRHAGPELADANMRLWNLGYLTTMSLQDARERFDGMVLLGQVTPATYRSPLQTEPGEDRKHVR